MLCTIKDYSKMTSFLFMYSSCVVLCYKRPHIPTFAIPVTNVLPRNGIISQNFQGINWSITCTAPNLKNEYKPLILLPFWLFLAFLFTSFQCRHLFSTRHQNQILTSLASVIPPPLSLPPNIFVASLTTQLQYLFLPLSLSENVTLFTFLNLSFQSICWPASP